jgi:hypothetical protein
MIRPGEYLAHDRSLRAPSPKAKVSRRSTLLQNTISEHGFNFLTGRQATARRMWLAREQTQTARIETALLTREHVSLALIKNSAETSLSERVLSIRQKIAARREMRSRVQVQEIVATKPMNASNPKLRRLVDVAAMSFVSVDDYAGGDS